MLINAEQGSKSRAGSRHSISQNIGAGENVAVITAADGVDTAAPITRRRRYKARARKCKRCGKQFTPKKKSGVFCSDTCRIAVHRRKKRLHAKRQPKPLHLIECAYCGKSNLRGASNALYCGTSCRNRAYTARRAAAVEALSRQFHLSDILALELLDRRGLVAVTKLLYSDGLTYDSAVRQFTGRLP